jgi:thiamine pyrophosphokinase
MADMVLVVANGDWGDSQLIETMIEASTFKIALDGAADRFESWDVVVGDMDSISNPEQHEANSNQDNSDLTKALKMYDVDAVVGVAGGRLDHQIAAYTSLFESNSDAILYFDGWRACRVDKAGLDIELQEGSICSLMPFGIVKNVTLTGVEFILENEDLNSGTKGVGNRVTERTVKISHEGGDLLFIWEANGL